MTRRPYHSFFLNPTVWATAEAHCTPRQLEILTLYYRDNLTQKEIGQRLGRGQPTIQKAIFGMPARHDHKNKLKGNDTPGVYGGALTKVRKALLKTDPDLLWLLLEQEQREAQDYAKARPERAVAYAKAYSATQKGKQTWRRWYETHREEAKARAKRNYLKSHEARLEYARTYYLAHKERILTQHRAQRARRLARKAQRA